MPSRIRILTTLKRHKTMHCSACGWCQKEKLGPTRTAWSSASWFRHTKKGISSTLMTSAAWFACREHDEHTGSVALILFQAYCSYQIYELCLFPIAEAPCVFTKRVECLIINATSNSSNTTTINNNPPLTNGQATVTAANGLIHRLAPKRK